MEGILAPSTAGGRRPPPAGGLVFRRSPRKAPSPDHFPPGPTMADANLSSFIWSVADLLRGDYKQSEYGKVILPFTVLRRLNRLKQMFPTFDRP